VPDWLTGDVDEPESDLEGDGPIVVEIAKPGERLLARIVDAVVVLLLSAPGTVPLLVVLSRHISHRLDELRRTATTVARVPLISGIEYGYLGGAMLVLALVGMVYEGVMLGMRGQTFGKRLAGLRVVESGTAEEITGGTATGRSFVYYLLSLIPLVNLANVLAVTWSRPYRQCWHDRVVSTMVVKA
jgi:uncharacterized RDD family membrane protein YckC